MAGLVRQSVIYARDSTPAGLADAFARQAAAMRHGPFGPIGQPPTVIIPGGPTLGAVVRARPPVSARPRALPVAPARSVAALMRAAPGVLPSLLGAADHIRVHRHCIAGYAAVFERVFAHSSGRVLIEPWAFTAALAEGGVCLFLNHDTGAPPLASQRDGTLFLEQDEVGLWFECALSLAGAGARLMAQILRREISGMSVGTRSTQSRLVAGVHVWSDMAATEISLMAPPYRPACVETFVLPTLAARRQRTRVRAR